MKEEPSGRGHSKCTEHFRMLHVNQQFTNLIHSVITTPNVWEFYWWLGELKFFRRKNYQNMICGVNTTSKGFLVAFKSNFLLEPQGHDLETGRSLELFFNFSLNWLKFKYAEHSIIYKKNQFCSNQDLSQVFLYYSSVNFSCFSWVLSLFPSHLWGGFFSSSHLHLSFYSKTQFQSTCQLCQPIIRATTGASR